ncbi:MAG: UDP-N-acetylmuramate--L-alanine ligase [Planctomycetota bacterium]|nr:UDP-N-acetylmuramate--L-alanine ligase [Planctomycetota bacterium]
MKVHCLGIGGAGLSGLARMLRAAGHFLTGEDAEEGPFLSGLRDAGIPITVGEDAPLPDGTELVVRSAAVPISHPRLREAAERRVPVQKYAQAITLAGEGQKLVAVAGTHGKTTTSALIAHILVQAGRDPSFLVGGNISHLGGSARRGAGEIFVAEACEYDRSFLHLSPWIGVITNIEADHLDFYRDLDEIVEAFGSFVERIHPDGMLLIPLGDEGAERAARRARCRVERFAIGSDSDWRGDRGASLPEGTQIRVSRQGRPVGSFSIPLPGLHNVSNGMAAIAAAGALDLSVEEIRQAISTFRTVDRRFQILLSGDDLAVVSDYAHHPTELETVLESCSQTFGDRRQVLVFQPHQRARTATFLDRFARTLSKADRVLVAPIYGAREGDRSGEVTSSTLVDRIRLCGGDADTLPDLPEIPGRVAEEIEPGDVVLVIGAGDIYQVAQPIADLGELGSPATMLSEASVHLSHLTSFKLGGPVNSYRTPENLQELREVVLEAGRTGSRILCVGGGNNLLARDEGFDGILVDLRRMNRLHSSRTRIIAEAGVSLPRLMRRAERLSLSGLEALAGIPGTVGGGVAMNAGGRNGAMSDFVDGVGIVLPDGEIAFRRKEEMKFRYRGCELGGGIVYEVVLCLRRGKREEIRRGTADIMKRKRRSQPYGQSSAGCIFRNPEGDSAGRLIESAGLKGERIGGAMVSMLHANFIVNDGEATSSDVFRLIERVQQAVRIRFGVSLELEVRVI